MLLFSLPDQLIHYGVFHNVKEPSVQPARRPKLSGSHIGSAWGALKRKSLAEGEGGGGGRDRGEPADRPRPVTLSGADRVTGNRLRPSVQELTALSSLGRGQ